MKLSKLTEIPSTRDMIDVFRGYNHNLRIGEGEFYDMTNLTSDDYPVLSPRPKRGIYASPSNPDASGLISKDNLCYVDGSDLYINKKRIEGFDLDPNLKPKTLISMGAYIIIMPDKKYINTEKHSDNGKIETTFEAKTDYVRFYLCNINGDAFDVEKAEIGTTAPQNPDNLDLWIDTSGDTHVLKMYSKTESQWVSVATTYIKILFPHSTTDFTTIFATNDGLTISGIGDVGAKQTDLSSTIKNQLKDLDGTMVAWDVGTNYIVVKGFLDKSFSLTLNEDNQISIKRLMPEMDFIIESGNRLWGCRYGHALNGQIVNEIYASKLGDFKNWNSFASISTDSYVASVGTDGQFTGAITHLGYPLFFKENCVHKVYGNYPANFQIQTTACRGVQNGCNKSLAIVNETLYYKSRSAVCAYDGSLPIEMSYPLGDVSYSDAVAGVLGNKYYVSMKDIEGESHLFVYDTAKGMWHREDNTDAVEFCNSGGNLYYIDRGTNQIMSVRVSPTASVGEIEDKTIKWEATTGIIGTDSPDKKYISRIVMRLSLEVGTKLYVQVQYDSCGVWEQLFALSGTSLKAFSIPIRPKRCDHLRLRFMGEGDAKIFSITKTTEQGSDA